MEDYIKACIVLHNFIMSENEKLYFTDQTVDGRLVPGTFWRDGSSYMSDIEGSTGGRLNVEAKLVMEQFMKYFMDDGALPSQDDWVEYEGFGDLF